MQVVAVVLVTTAQHILVQQVEQAAVELVVQTLTALMELLTQAVAVAVQLGQREQGHLVMAVQVL
jgi:hypothetical protein